MGSLAHRFDAAPANVDEFLRLYEGVEGRFEFVDGRVVDMGRTTLAHGLIVAALLLALRSRLPHDLQVVPASVAVVPDEDTARLPDLLVVPRGHAPGALKVDDPVLLGEVLSTSTTHVDFGAKTTEYHSLPTVMHYLIASQDGVNAWLWTRGDDGAWPEEPILLGADDEVDLTALGVRFAMSELSETL